jgi:protein-S-isoprenylcysteine O-methyltransferase Ste14
MLLAGYQERAGGNAAPDGTLALITRALRFFATRRMAVSRAVSAGLLVLVISTESAHAGTLLATVLFAAGLALVGVATVGRLWCSLYISGYKNAQLVTMGPYSVSRHPLYFFSLLGIVGVGLTTETIAIPAAAVLLALMGYPTVIGREESVLRARFGAAFDAYRAATPALLPAWRLYAEPASWVVNPKLFRRTMVDVVWFVWLVALIELMNALHTLHVIEPLFHLQ